MPVHLSDEICKLDRTRDDDEREKARKVWLKATLTDLRDIDRRSEIPKAELDKLVAQSHGRFPIIKPLAGLKAEWAWDDATSPFRMHFYTRFYARA
jgi:hypothetical protein